MYHFVVKKKFSVIISNNLSKYVDEKRFFLPRFRQVKGFYYYENVISGIITRNYIFETENLSFIMSLGITQKYPFVIQGLGDG